MKSVIVSLFLFISATNYAQQKKEIRYLFVKNKSDISFDVAKDSSRASFSIKKFSDGISKVEENNSVIYFGFSHRKATRIKALPSVTLEEYYSNPSAYFLSNRMYIIIPLSEKTFAIWKCSELGK